jgi:hypothetical protein
MVLGAQLGELKMTLTMPDTSMATLTWIKGTCKVRFHAIDKTMVLPTSVEPTIELVSKLYIEMKKSV